ncbi:MAG TPA: SPOR domain-containing protein [Alphaproteobacteria bacterium]|nr:SPOR domain-containing protein [Alphaproteobacteria bacterium]HNS45461.1 SPOR domain-containing protein [Alphaproteobacteria bacterium]
MSRKKQFGTRSRDEFDDEGFFESVLKRQGTTPMPPSMAKLLMMVAGLAVVATIVAIVWATWPSGDKGRVDENALPVLHADAESYKIKPEEPGGMAVPNKDSTIFETLNAGSEKKDVENLLDDAEEPLTKEEAFGNEEETEEPEQSAVVAEEPVKEPEVKEVKKEEPKPAPIVAKVEEKLAPKEEPKPVVKTEPKPAPAVETIKISSGSSYVQLAAVKSDAEAKTKWAKLQSQYSVLKSMPLRVQKADLGAKGTFYRVQAGPMSLNDAQNACAKIKSAKGDCLVIKQGE